MNLTFISVVLRNTFDVTMLSVICPIYNEEKYIARCIESIIQQDYPKELFHISSDISRYRQQRQESRPQVAGGVRNVR